jgi:hypothetical protein
LDVNYALVITTNAGLWRYIVGDTIKFTSKTPYRFLITGRTSHFINVFGEEVVVQNTDKAIASASEKTGAQIREYTVAPIFLNTIDSGSHHWLIEFEEEPEDFERFKNLLDESLRSLNSDYDAKRKGNMVLDFPLIEQVPKGTFEEWLRTKNKLGGQHKIPRLSNKRELLEQLLQTADQLKVKK